MTVGVNTARGSPDQASIRSYLHSAASYQPLCEQFAPVKGNPELQDLCDGVLPGLRPDAHLRRRAAIAHGCQVAVTVAVVLKRANLHACRTGWSCTVNRFNSDSRTISHTVDCCRMLHPGSQLPSDHI